MKRFYIFLTLMLSLFGVSNVSALDLPNGVLGIGDAATSLETGKWYYLFNQGTHKYIQENGSNALKQVGITPAGLDANDGIGFLITLEEATDGKYYIKTGRGNYYKGPGSSARGTGATATSSWAMSIDPIEGAEGHFILMGNTYNMIAPADGGDIKGGAAKTAGSTGDWVFYTATVADASELTGRELYNYQMSKLGPIRLHNKRSSTAYLTTTEAGKAMGAPLATKGLVQVWLLEASGSGYTLRSAHTGEYLQENFDSPESGTEVLYIQFSPNNTGDMAYVNISSKEDFSGSSCLNLGNDGTTLHKWSYANDAGCDWAIELAEDVTEDDIRASINGSKGYVESLKDGAYYHIVSTAYNRVMTEADNIVKSLQQDDSNYSQYWKLEKNGTGYAFQNVVTQKYIQRQTSLSSYFVTGDNPVPFYPTRTNDKWEFKWTIANSNGGSQGMHTANSQGYGVVLWTTNASASQWAFVEVELTDEEIEAARGSFNDFQELVANVGTYQAHLDNLFADKACSTLKSDIQALTDEQLAANADYAALNTDMKAMVLKVKNDTWQQYTNASTGYTAGYEKFFRIADYKVYSHYQEMTNDQNFRMSNSFGKLSGPTGIIANASEVLYIYVDEVPSSDCTLQLEAVSTNGVPGQNQTGAVTDLHQGLNIYMSNQQVMLYIFYQLNDTRKYLANYPDIKIHIEGGQLNGYWDRTRGMTNADWKLLQQDLLKASPVLNLKTEHLVFAMDAPLVKAAEPNEMEGLTSIWDHIVVNEERYMGVEDFEGRLRNVWNVFSVDYNFMFASTYGTYYNNSTLSGVMNFDRMTALGTGDIWGPSHEIGHNHQATIKLAGTTESSNNMFSNINTFERGTTTTRYQSPVGNFEYTASNTPWVGRKIEVTTRMFFQLYLYFHAMHHDDNFLPNLFRALRKDPIYRGDWDSSLHTTTAKGEEINGGYKTYGKQDYLHFAKKVCDLAQADLSEFFEAYGMFIPVKDYHIGDYANYFMTTTEADIKEAKAYMQKYPKKLGNIMFIDDHIVRKKCNPDPAWYAKIPADGYKIDHDNGNGTKVGTAGDAGDFEEFDGRTEYSATGDYFTLSGSTITFKGEGYIGHKFYDKEGNLIWATNYKSTTLPASLRTLGVENFTVVTAEANMQDSPCPYYKSGEKKVYKSNIYFGNEEGSRIWWASEDTDLGSFMPENAIGVIGSKNATENIINTPNIISMENTAESIVLNGDKPAYIPVDATAESVKFTKTIDGYAALNLPFEVTSSDISGLQTMNYDGTTFTLAAADKVAAGSPVVINGNASISVSNVVLHSGNYQELTDANILAADGQSITSAVTASPFTYNLGNGTGIVSLSQQGNSDKDDAIYDLSGRRVGRTTKAGLYIVNGKKFLIK